MGVTADKPIFEECGGCGHLHVPEFRGDCRSDANRFSFDQLDEKYGVHGYQWRDLADQLRSDTLPRSVYWEESV
jgi:hypothetical protein